MPASSSSRAPTFPMLAGRLFAQGDGRIPACGRGYGCLGPFSAVRQRCAEDTSSLLVESLLVSSDPFFHGNCIPLSARSSPGLRHETSRHNIDVPDPKRRSHRNCCAINVDGKEILMQKIAPCLWFDGEAEEAMNFYTSIFENSKVGNVTRYGEAGPGENGSVMVATFEIEGQEFVALNGGPMFKFSPAISFVVHCATQEEVDDFWAKLLEGGAPQQCGWLTDKFGVSWQIVPTILPEMLQDKDAEKTERR